MATAIKAIPTLKGKEAREFLRRAEEAEREFKGNKNKDPWVQLEKWILESKWKTN